MLLEYSYESKPSGYGCDGPPRRSSYIHLAHHRYEHPGQSPGLRIQAVIAGARSVRSNQLLSSVMIRPTGGIISVYGKSPGQQPWARACLHVMAHGCLSMQNGCQWQAFCITRAMSRITMPVCSFGDCRNNQRNSLSIFRLVYAKATGERKCLHFANPVEGAS